MVQDIQMNAIDEKEVFADEVTIMHNPTRFFMDIKNITPRMDGKNMRLLARHNLVILDPFTMKSMLEALKKNVEIYEKKYGEIKEPEAMKKDRELLEKKGKDSTKSDTNMSYIG